MLHNYFFKLYFPKYFWRYSAAFGSSFGRSLDVFSFIGALGATARTPFWSLNKSAIDIRNALTLLFQLILPSTPTVTIFPTLLSEICRGPSLVPSFESEVGAANATARTERIIKIFMTWWMKNRNWLRELGFEITKLYLRLIWSPFYQTLQIIWIDLGILIR